MKKIVLIILTVFLNIALHSCSPDAIPNGTTIHQATGDGDGEILPPEDPDEGGN